METLGTHTETYGWCVTCVWRSLVPVCSLHARSLVGMISSISDQITHNTTATANTHSPECLHVSPLTIRCTHGLSAPRPFNTQGNCEGKKEGKKTPGGESLFVQWSTLLLPVLIKLTEEDYHSVILMCFCIKESLRFSLNIHWKFYKSKQAESHKREHNRTEKNRQCVTKSTHLNDKI